MRAELSQAQIQRNMQQLLAAQGRKASMEAGAAVEGALFDADLGITVQEFAAPLDRLSTGQLVVGRRTITASGAVGASDTLILADATAGAIVLALPAAAASDGRQLTVKKIDASANTVTLDPNGAETIDGAATHVLAAQYDSVTVFGTGSAWGKE